MQMPVAIMTNKKGDGLLPKATALSMDKGSRGNTVSTPLVPVPKLAERIISSLF
jgi:hypothetical protein